MTPVKLVSRRLGKYQANGPQEFVSSHTKLYVYMVKLGDMLVIMYKHFLDSFYPQGYCFYKVLVSNT